MQTLPAKSWNANVDSSKKYLSRMLTYELSTQLNSKEFDVLYESPLSKMAHDETDVVVFDKRRGWSSVMAIEICKSNEIDDMMIIARDLMQKYSLLDFFLLDQDADVWYNIKKSLSGYDITSNTFFMGVDLNKLYEKNLMMI